MTSQKLEVQVRTLHFLENIKKRKQNSTEIELCPICHYTSECSDSEVSKHLGNSVLLWPIPILGVYYCTRVKGIGYLDFLSLSITLPLSLVPINLVLQ